MNGEIVPHHEIIYIIGGHLVGSLSFKGNLRMRCHFAPVEMMPADTMNNPSATTPVSLSATPV